MCGRAPLPRQRTRLVLLSQGIRRTHKRIWVRAARSDTPQPGGLAGARRFCTSFGRAAALTARHQADKDMEELLWRPRLAVVVDVDQLPESSTCQHTIGYAESARCHLNGDLLFTEAHGSAATPAPWRNRASAAWPATSGLHDASRACTAGSVPCVSSTIAHNGVADSRGLCAWHSVRGAARPSLGAHCSDTNKT